MADARTAAVSDWLTEMTNGGVPDQQWLAIEKHFKHKFNDASGIGMKIPKQSPDAIAAKFLQEINAGDHIHSKTAELFDQFLQAALEEQRELPAGDEGLQAEIEDLKHELGLLHAAGARGPDVALRARVRQAHDWRFRLEQAVRSAHGRLEAFLTMHQRAPTSTELARIVADLEEALL